MLKKRISLFSLVFLLLAACLPQSNETVSPAWAYADLRALDSPGQGSPALDLIALYTRFIGSEFQVRLDLLDSTPAPDSDFYIALNYQPGGKRRLPINAESDVEWDVLISLPADGPIEIQSSGGQPIPGAELRVTRDPILDTIVVSLESGSLFRGSPFTGPRTIQIQAFVTQAGSHEIADSIGPARSGDLPPGQVPVLVALWNTFPAVTPAQALRRWDGAHSGPFNARHGLKSVIDGVRASGFPVALLDLNNPESLSSLDALGKLAQLHELARIGFLLLPEAVPIKTEDPGDAFQPPGWVFSRVATENRRYSQGFGLPASPFLFVPQLDESLLNDDYAKNRNAHFLFSLHQPSAQDNQPQFLYSPFRWQGIQVLSIQEDRPDTRAPGENNGKQQVSQDGPSLEVRRALVMAAMNREPGGDGSIFVLGGDLSRSAWGDPLAASAGLHYLAAHPWVRPMSGYDLLASRPSHQATPQAGVFSVRTAHPLAFIPQDATGEPLVSGLDTAQIQAQSLADLQKSPPGPITEAAWRAYLSLLAPAVPDLQALTVLRAASLRQIGPLLAAARWQTQGLEAVCKPARSPCMTDLDWDGQEEIVLASDRFLGVIESQGAILTYAFMRRGNEAHQLIGPSTQFTVGLSDPTLWKPERGIAGDPKDLPGAFADIPAGFDQPTWESTKVTLSTDKVILTSADGNLQKTIQLLSDGLDVTYISAQPLRVQIPLVIDPWNRFQPGWIDLYQEKPAGTGWSWGLAHGPRVLIHTSGELAVQAFRDSRDVVKLPEDPNFNYPVGHYLPYPMALAEVKGEGEFSIEITFLP